MVHRVQCRPNKPKHLLSVSCPCQRGRDGLFDPVVARTSEVYTGFESRPRRISVIVAAHRQWYKLFKGLECSYTKQARGRHTLHYRPIKGIEWGFRPPSQSYKTGPGEPPADGEMIEMTPPSRFWIQNLIPGGLRPSTLPFGHVGSPQYWIITSKSGRNILFLWNLKARVPSRQL